MARRLTGSPIPTGEKMKRIVLVAALAAVGFGAALAQQPEQTQQPQQGFDTRLCMQLIGSAVMNNAINSGNSQAQADALQKAFMDAQVKYKAEADWWAQYEIGAVAQINDLRARLGATVA